jgi:hypothetical protein
MREIIMRNFSIWKTIVRLSVALAVLLGSVVLTLSSSRAQETDLKVPDLTGLSVPLAAQALNNVGLLLGTETQQAWTASAKVKENQVSSQQPAADKAAAPGSTVNVTVLRVFNARLVYNDINVTLLNLSKSPLDIKNVTLESGKGDKQTQFNAVIWGQTLAPGDCFRLWVDIPVKAPSPDCTTLKRNIQATQTVQHFWRDPIGSFRLEQNGNQLVECQIASKQCDLTLPQGENTGDYTDYMVFSYRSTHFTVRNESPQQWMTLSDMDLVGRITGKRFSFEKVQPITRGDVPWDGQRLAPGQCIVYSELDLGSLPPYNCKVVGYVKIEKGAAFWTRGFTTIGKLSRRYSQCDQAPEGKASVCIVPR